jgi:DNA-binding transcriptional LysR family regulator
MISCSASLAVHPERGSSGARLWVASQRWAEVVGDAGTLFLGIREPSRQEFSDYWVEPMADLNSLIVFAKVVEANSFSEAARRLKMPISTVSRRIAELEDQLGVRLIDRSTRSLRLTELGAEVLEHAIRSAEIGEAVENIVSNRLSTVSGTLRLSAPPTISDTLLTPLVTGFQASYPNVRVQIFVTDRHIDHIAEGIDLAFRLGRLRDSSLVARKILTYRRQLVASPEYLKTREAPDSPQGLLDHRLLAFWRRGPEASWTFLHKDGECKETVVFHLTSRSTISPASHPHCWRAAASASFRPWFSRI